LDDAEAIRRTRAGDRESFGVLVDRYGARITRLVRGYVRNEQDVQDVVQDSFVKAFSRLDRFDGRSAFYTWLYRIAANTAMDHNKKWKRRPTPLTLSAPGEDEDRVGIAPPHRGPPPEAGAMQAEIREALDAALESLPDRYREVLVLRELEGLTYEEMATTLRLSRGTVESRLFRARERLRTRLGPLADQL